MGPRAFERVWGDSIDGEVKRLECTTRLNFLLTLAGLGCVEVQRRRKLDKLLSNARDVQKKLRLRRTIESAENDFGGQSMSLNFKTLTSAMKHANRLLTPAEKLLRAYAAQGRLPRSQIPSQTYATFSRRKGGNIALRSPEDIPSLARKLDGFVLDDSIETQYVQVKQDDGVLSEPQLLQRLLRSIDRNSQVISQIVARGPSSDAAIVEVTSRDALIKRTVEREKQMREQQRNTKASKPKQIELNWAIAENDLNIKLRTMEEFLEKGKKVEIMLASRKRQKRASPDEAQLLLKNVRDRINDIGAREAKHEGQLLKHTTLTVEKKAQDS